MFEQIKDKFCLSETQWKMYSHYFQRMELPAKTTLLKEGEIAKKVFLVEKGCLRAWFNNDGKDISFQFFMENSMVASIESFQKEIPSLINIETIEPSIIWHAQKNDIQKIIVEIVESTTSKNHFIQSIFERTFDYMKYYLSFIRDTPEQRYLHLLEEKPEIIQRIPQHYIASYLGISTVHLSRVKKKLAQNRHSRPIG